MDPDHREKQLGSMVKHHNLVVEGQVQIWELILIRRSLAEWQLSCK
jgi:hypothetical protein